MREAGFGVTQLSPDSSAGPETSRADGLTFFAYALLAAGALFSPLEVLATNFFMIGHAERLLAVALIVWVLSASLARVLVRRGVRSTTATFSVFFATVIVVRGAPFIHVFGPAIAWLVIAVLILAISYLLSRMDRHSVVRGACLCIAAGLVLGPIAGMALAMGNQGESRVVFSPPQTMPLVHRPDIFLVVVDGYVGLKTLERDFGVVRPEIETSLLARGYQLPASAWSAYPSTRSSLPSLLDMSYSLPPGEAISDASASDLLKIIGGANALNSTLQANGYESVMVESGWSGSTCGAEIDRCIAAPLLDEAMFILGERSATVPLLRQTVGYAFTLGTQRTMGWLIEHSREISIDSRPIFVFTHLMAPHAPFFLGSNCETIYDERRSGVAFARPADDVDDRRSFYLEQASCIDRFLLEFDAHIEPDDIVVIAADHGSDQRNQLRRDPESWTADDLMERYNVFMAVRSGVGCSVGDTVVLPNLFRRLLSCLSDQALADLEPRMLKHALASIGGRPSPIIEVEPALIETLLYD
jgi:hypothetical protein